MGRAIFGRAAARTRGCLGSQHDGLYGTTRILGRARALLQNRLLFQAICPGSLWARDNRCLLSRVQRLAGPAGGQGPFVPVGGTNRDKRVASNRDKRVAFYPGWWLQPGQKALAPLSPSLSPRPSHSAHLFLAVLGSGDGSSYSFFHHICEDL